MTPDDSGIKIKAHDIRRQEATRACANATARVARVASAAVSSCVVSVVDVVVVAVAVAIVVIRAISANSCCATKFGQTCNILSRPLSKSPGIESEIWRGLYQSCKLRCCCCCCLPR